MGLELHRRDDSADLEIRIVKTFPKWLTADQYEEIPLEEAAVLHESLVAALPPETLNELARLLSKSGTAK